MGNMGERRSETRSMCADVLEIHWKDEAGKARRATALLEDISPSGACLQLESAIPSGAEVSWDCGRSRFAGHVRYCSYREIGYFAGVEFNPDARWSKRAYRPQHLLDLRRLMSRS